ncbi:MAG: hypothetical protein IJY65_02750 [Clostridia bacterium]|nr:hypothetical protein [Clostridia bacterium]
MKKFISLILALTLLLSALVLTSCGGNETDGGEIDNGGNEGDGGNGGEGSGGTSEPMLELIKDKVASFTIVSNQKDAEINAAVNNWIEMLALYGVEAKHVADYSVNKMQDCEILIGTGLVQRDEYAVDIHDFGDKGYVIKVVNDKVVICGGNTESTVEAMTHFLENYIGINVATVDVVDVSVSKTLSFMKVQDDYPIKSITVNGEGVKDLYISASRTTPSEYAAAQNLQAALYSSSGVWLDILYYENDTSDRVKVELVDDAGEDGFRVYVDTDGNLTFHCAYKNAFSKGVAAFEESVLKKASGTLDFTDSYNYTSCVSVVKYSEFGAKGNGAVDDLAAIVATHEYANEGGQRVEADPGKTYYIAGTDISAIIKTDVDWKDAEFIIDDRGVFDADRNHWIFKVLSDAEPYTVKLPENYSLKTTDTNIGLTFDESVLLFIENETEKTWLRYPNGAGYNKQEVVIVDKDGNLDPLTPLVFDYGRVTTMKAYAIDDKPITIKGGTFTTWANLEESMSRYYARGLYVQRANTTVYGVTHLVDKEPETVNGSRPYYGFFFTEYSHNITFDSCVMTSHKYYTSGTYDTWATRATAVTWKNCTQSDRIDRFAEGYWGVMASKFTKNLTFENCVLSRFDAHEGVCNVTIKDSEIGEIINLVGWGTAVIENTKVTSGNKNYFVRLREDYGSTWEGDIYITNCEIHVANTSKKAYVVRADWYEHYFGYDCYLPNLYVDGFKVKYLNGNDFTGTLNIIKTLNGSYPDLRNNKTNPLVMPEVISVKNVEHTYDVLEGTVNDVMLDNTTVIEGKDEE